MCTYSRDKGHKKWVRKYCLGCYECPGKDCDFTEGPRQVRKGKKKFGDPQPPLKFCPKHPTLPLIHNSCEFILKTCFDELNSLWEVECSGIHSKHKMPPIEGRSVHIGDKSRAVDFMNAHLYAKPSQLILGNNKGRPSVTKISSAYFNRNTVAHLRKKLEGPTIMSTKLEDVISFIKDDYKGEFGQVLKDAKFQPGEEFICFQHDDMKNHI